MTADLMTLFREYEGVNSLSNNEFVFKGNKYLNGPIHPDSVMVYIVDFSKKYGVNFSF